MNAQRYKIIATKTQPRFNRPKNIGQRQQGMILVVCMLVVLVVTLIVVSGTSTSSLEEQAATNAQTYNRTFQAAESGISVAIDDQDMMNEALDDNTTCTSSTASVQTTTPGVTATVQLTFIDRNHSDGDEIGTYVAFRFDSVGTGEMVDMKSATTIRQGFNRRVPTGDNNTKVPTC
ncbi:PilX N-terminal domain-containing pilus assembly protein [Motiliproteus sp. MSK22-1]|uniref:PilX N-terminal domain-containing pilus assembly protein n=1 Tax=Motiliproteus sp. MSK22-1 TaxID=1897630 RepID=UPI000976D97B|nr:PilX N-terminal domain-containing pilus assembly protein [Motiliproteus sp. MSK22-1]OMH33722.1 hypothetical protein BGP75_12020 [Motiliproteus sp. MSK22-1]